MNKPRSMSSFDSSKPSVGRERAPNPSDLVEMLEWPKKGGSVQGRLVGPIAGRGVHKIKVAKRDGSETEISKACLAYDPSTDSSDPEVKCPYCSMDRSVQRFSKVYFSNFIDRRIEEDKPAKIKTTPKEAKTGIKDIDSSSWTPARVIRAPSTLALRFKQLGEKNIVKSKTGEKKSFPVNHPKYGFDVDVSFDKSLPAASMYSADRNTDERYTPVTEGEYLLWDLDQLYVPEDLKTAKAEAKSLSERWAKHTGEEADEDEDAPKKKRRTTDDDDIDLDDDDTPKSKKKSKAKSKPSDEDDDDIDLDDDGDEDDEDDTPPKRSKGKASAKRKSRDADDEDEDEDADADEDEDEDELDLDSDEDGDEDEDDAPPPKRSKKPAAKSKPKAKSKRRNDDDDDDIDDLDEDEDEDEDSDADEDDEDEDDAPPPKRSKKPAAKAKQKTGAKSKRRNDDDDDDDLDI